MANIDTKIAGLKESINKESSQDYIDYLKAGEADLLATRLNNIKKVNEAEAKVSQAIIVRFGKEKAEKAAYVKNQLKDIDTKLKKELEAGKKLTKAQKKEIEARYAEEKKQLLSKNKEVEKALKAQEKLERDIEYRKTQEAGKQLTKDLFAKGSTVNERLDAIKTAFTAADGTTDIGGGISTMISALSSWVGTLNTEIDNIAKKKSTIDTAMQGSRHATGGMFGIGSSYWDNMSRNITGIAAVSPFVTQKAIVGNLETLVKSGITFNVEQRAFLATIKDKIADTFNAQDTTLLRLIRIQQQDSTAARLGMESSMTSFLNNMYETSEYMKDQASAVRSSLAEAQALMGASQALSFEYQVQKWAGSLYSVGMNNANSIASAVGKLAAGDISGITSGGTSNLLLMAANQAGLSVSDMLAKGLNESDTNKLLASVVDYLDEIYNSTRDSKVVQQQIASVYGLTASDLRAAANLRSSLGTVSSKSLSYGGAIGQLESMMASIGKRTSIAEMTTNAMENLKYTMSAGIANNPALYGIYKMGTLLRDVAGGIALPDIKVMGSGVNLRTSVADLMLVGALSGSILSGIGSLVTSGGNGGITGSGLLKAAGIGSGMTSVTRGDGGKAAVFSQAGGGLSESGYIGNSSSSDVLDSTMASANDDKNRQMVEAQDETSEITMGDVNENVVKIYELLESVINGGNTIKTVDATFAPNI